MRVQAVALEHSGPYFDLHVPGEEHYLAEGLWSHNTGKSRNWAEFLLVLATTYPNARILVVRKTLASLRESWQQTFEDEVLWPGHPALEGPSRHGRKFYNFSNGSTIVLGGMDRPTRLFSTQWDCVYVQEACEFTEDEWERLHRALRNQSVPPDLRILGGDCNPEHFGHWLNQRCIAGKTVRIQTKHEDNPSVTPDYLDRLRNLTGVRRDRLYLGLWKSAEGLILPNFEGSTHILAAHELWDNAGRLVLHVPAWEGMEGRHRGRIPIDWTYGSIDWGRRHACCFQVWGATAGYGHFRLAEIHRRGLLSDTFMDWIAELHEKYDLRAIAADPAEPDSIDRANIRLSQDKRGAIGSIVRKANNAREASWDLLGDLLEPIHPNGCCGIYWVAGAHPYGLDQESIFRKLPTSSETEIPYWLWRKTEEGKAEKEEPDPTCQDDGIAALRYAQMFSQFQERDMTPEPQKREWAADTFGAETGFDEVDVEY